MELYRLELRKQRKKNLKDPMCTTQEPGDPQSKYIMCCEWLHDLRQDNALLV